MMTGTSGRISFTLDISPGHAGFDFRDRSVSAPARGIVDPAARPPPKSDNTITNAARAIPAELLRNSASTSGSSSTTN